MAAEIHVDDEGTSFRITVLDEASRVVDLTGAERLEVWFRRPDQVPLVREADVHGDPSAGVMEYVTASGDLSIAGAWRVQGHVALPGGLIHTNVHKFRVYPNVK